MRQSNKKYARKLFDWITYGINLSFNDLIDEKRRNGEVFVFEQEGKVVHVNADDVPYRVLKIPE